MLPLRSAEGHVLRPRGCNVCGSDEVSTAAFGKASRLQGAFPFRAGTRFCARNRPALASQSAGERPWLLRCGVSPPGVQEVCGTRRYKLREEWRRRPAAEDEAGPVPGCAGVGERSNWWARLSHDDALVDGLLASVRQLQHFKDPSGEHPCVAPSPTDDAL